MILTSRRQAHRRILTAAPALGYAQAGRRIQRRSASPALSFAAGRTRCARALDIVAQGVHVLHELLHIRAGARSGGALPANSRRRAAKTCGRRALSCMMPRPALTRRCAAVSPRTRDRSSSISQRALRTTNSMVCANSESPLTCTSWYARSSPAKMRRAAAGERRNCVSGTAPGAAEATSPPSRTVRLKQKGRTSKAAVRPANGLQTPQGPTLAP